jgi:predicted nucleic acid-binding protein
MKIEITPVVVLPDMSPLIHLAAAGRLALLQEFGRVVVMDIVAFEASGDLTRPWARDVAEWLQRGQEAGSNQPVEVAKTEIGEAYRLARQADPGFTMRDAGDRAIRDWLVDMLPEIGGPALVIYEDKRMPRLIQREHLEEVVVVATTRAVLSFAEERGLISSAEEVWNDIVKLAAGANPSQAVQVLRPTRTP